ncbi:hypothetical protein [Acerihabitans arboris]|uniref:Uncharacterized protein n=1 Tax=Acerihabitans arboris TaxID=2691583 RepID=A0A845SKN5_9GAMM|nr:hypothetical protein [Acerihabitans arboris]NDL65843.1 hypothetical protein [Acerihabitans arboris]
MIGIKKIFSVAGLILATGFYLSTNAEPYRSRSEIGPPWDPPFDPWGPTIVLYPPTSPHVIYISPAPPQVWVEKSSHYRYYCPKPVGYYPNIKKCPKGWMKIVFDTSK